MNSRVLRIAFVAVTFTATGVLVFFQANYALPALADSQSPFRGFMSVLSMIGIAGFFVGLYKPRSGSIMLLLSGIGMFSLFAFSSEGHHIALALLCCIPFISAGVLMLFWHRKARSGK